MNDKFTVNDILSLAREIETRGSAFYDEAALISENDEFRQVLAELAEMEREHRDFFENLLSKPDSPAHLQKIDDENELSFIRALGAHAVFHKKRTAKEFNTLVEVFVFALEREKDSILFYEAVKGLIEEDETRNKITDIISQEKQHFAVISEMLEKHVKSE